VKLPDFIQFEPLNRLRQLMGAELGSFTPAKNPDRLTLAEIEQLSISGVEIPLDQVRILDDGTLAYKNARVILYIRDVVQYRNSGFRQDELPKFHVSDCQRLQEMRANKRYERYVVATREDGLFALNISAKDVKGFNHRTEKLNVCQYCLGKLAWQGFDHSLPRPKRAEIVAAFTPKTFFDAYGKSLVVHSPLHTADTAPLNTYTDDFKAVSDRLKKERGYRCDQCKIDLSMHRQFLNAHHINGQKSDNSPSNIKVVCIRCHAEEYLHGQLKSLPEYKKFIKMFGESFSKST
jgi:hypothetical protein